MFATIDRMITDMGHWLASALIMGLAGYAVSVHATSDGIDLLGKSHCGQTH